MCLASLAADVVLPDPWRPTRAIDGRVAHEAEGPVARGQERGELLVDDLHDLLAGGEALEDLRAQRPLAHPRDEVLDDLEVDVRLEQRETDLAHRSIEVRFGHAAATGQPGEGLAEAVAEGVEHAEAGTLVTDDEDQVARRTPGGWCAGSGDTEASGVYAMPRAGAPGRRSRDVYPPPVTVDPLLDPVPPTHAELPSPGLRRNRAFMLLWSAATVSVFGSFVTRIALPFVAIETLRAGPIEIAALRAVDLVAALLVGFVAGAWVDRLRRRPVMIWADLGRAVLLGSIPVAAIGGWLTLAQVLLVSSLAAVLTTFFDVADKAYLPTVVGRAELVRANGALAATSSAMEFLAFGAAGFLVKLLTAPIAIAIDACSFIISAGFLGGIRRPEPPPPPAADREPISTEIREGMRIVVRDPVLRGLLWGTIGLAAMWGVFGSTWLLFANGDLGLDAAVIGVVAALGGFGSLVGALLAERMAGRFGLGRLVVASLLVAALGNLLIPLAPAGMPLVAVAFLVGQQLIGDTAVTVYDVTEISMRQARVEDRHLGRVNATVRVVMVLAMLVGTVVGGLVAEAVGLRCGGVPRAAVRAGRCARPVSLTGVARGARGRRAAVGLPPPARTARPMRSAQAGLASAARRHPGDHPASSSTRTAVSRMDPTFSMSSSSRPAPVPAASHSRARARSSTRPAVGEDESRSSMIASGAVILTTSTGTTIASRTAWSMPASATEPASTKRSTPASR